MADTKELNPIVKVLMERDDMTAIEAHDFALECLQNLPQKYTYIDIEEMLMCDFGLEPDYIMDLITFMEDNPYVED